MMARIFSTEERNNFFKSRTKRMCSFSLPMSIFLFYQEMILNSNQILTKTFVQLRQSEIIIYSKSTWFIGRASCISVQDTDVLCCYSTAYLLLKLNFDKVLVFVESEATTPLGFLFTLLVHYASPRVQLSQEFGEKKRWTTSCFYGNYKCLYVYKDRNCITCWILDIIAAISS